MDIKLDAETRAKLIGLMPVRQGATTEFVPPCFRDLPEAVRPVFIQRAFTRAERAEVQQAEAANRAALSPYTFKDGEDIRVRCDDPSKSADFIDVLNKRKAAESELARKSVVGWRNVYCPSSGEEIVFKGDAVAGADAELWSGFYIEAREQLFENAKLISSLTQQERQGLK